MFFEVKIVLGEISDKAMIKVHQVKEAIMADYRLFQLPKPFKKDGEPIDFIFFSRSSFYFLRFWYLSYNYLIFIILVLCRHVFNAYIEIFLFSVLEENRRKHFKYWLSKFEVLCCVFWTFRNSIDSFQKQMNGILVLRVDVFHEGFKGLILIITFEFLHLSQLKVIDPLSYPLVPIHPIICVELDASKLHW